VQIIKTSMKWFVEINKERGQEHRIEACASLREARRIVEREEAGADFDAATDSLAIYRGKSWHTAKVFKRKAGQSSAR
jgi:hypothetical protein